MVFEVFILMSVSFVVRRVRDVVEAVRVGGPLPGFYQWGRVGVKRRV